MSEELLINVSPMESRVALMNDGVLSEIYIERQNKLGLVGNIYLGTVVRILPGMQAAFIDIGQSRTAFLHVNDMQKISKKNNDTVDDYQQITDVNINTNMATNMVAHAIPDSTHIDPRFGQSRHIEQTLQHAQNHFVDSQHTYHSRFIPAERDNLENTDSLTNSESSSSLTEVEEQTTQPSAQSSISPIHSSISPSNLASASQTRQSTDDVSVYIDATSTKTNTNTQKTVQPMVDISHIKTLSTISTLPNALLNATANTRPHHTLSTTTAITTNADHVDKSNASNGNHATAKENSVSASAGIGSNQSSHSNQSTQSKKDSRKEVNSEELIQNRLHEKQRILVQVTKDQLGTKGARLTTNISLPSRYLVYLPSGDHIGISQRIDNTEERTRLKAELAELMQTVNLKGGLIARTAAEHISKAKLEEDIYYLLQLWRTIQARRHQASAHLSSVLVYQELSLPLRSIRDLVSDSTQRVVVDDPYMYDHLRQFSKEFVPMIFPRIVPHQSDQALFDIHRVEEDLQNALKRRVNLKSGGYLIIDQTEAMTTIDVNTGSFVGGRSLEDTVYKTNLEATHSIARQLRLRNLGGIIILDFIDMEEQEHKDDVLISLQTQLSQDYAKTNITQVSELGLVEMTRKRTRESLEQQLCETCPTCNGNGFIKTAETVCFDIFREIMRCARTYNAPKKFTVVAHAAVIDLLLTSEADTVADLEYLLGRVITFEVESRYTQEQYDIVLD